MLRLWLLLLLGLCLSLEAGAQDDDELNPGLVVRYAAEGRVVEVIEPDVSQTWDTAAPDERLPIGEFEATWSGHLLMQSDGPHRWMAFVQGRVSVEIDGRMVLSGDSATASWLTGEATDIGLGLKPLRVFFAKKGERAELHLFWSSNSFGLEPLPSQFLFHPKARHDLALIERGREQFANYRCGRCHVRENADAAAPGPSLKSLKLGRPSEQLWAERRLRGTVPDSAMPQILNSSREVAAALQAVQERATAPKLESLPKAEKKRTDELDRAEGLSLLKSTGCLACHELDERSNARGPSELGPHEVGSLNSNRGPSFRGVADRHSNSWLFTWLTDPARLNASHRMPVFRLSEQERRQLVLALSSDATRYELAPAAAATSPSGAPTTSAESAPDSDGPRLDSLALLKAGRCTACHEIPGVPPADVSRIPSLSDAVNWDNSCLKAGPRAAHQPTYREADAAAIRAYVESFRGPLSRVSDAERGRRLLASKGCLACHPRGTSSGLAPVAKALAAADTTLIAPSLVPPHLTAVGDKLVDNALSDAISGEQQVRKPWLKVRMPKFAHSATEKAAIVSHFVTHDRIPPGHLRRPNDLASKPKQEPATPTTADKVVTDQELILGQTLVGPRGLSCIACHQVGAYVPKNVALGTRGSDLLALRSRMREPFFHRWVHGPLRIVPGMEMPSYATRAVKGVLNDDINAQLDLLWRTLSDARFKAPTDPGSVEQYVVVHRGGPERIVRDVFTNPATADRWTTKLAENSAPLGAFVPRAFAVGLRNQHNALFDLDTLTLRAWTFGDLARQRTVGKSWYWDLAGSVVATARSRESDYLLESSTSKDGPHIAPIRREGTVGQLVSYRLLDTGSARPETGAGVEFVFDLNFELADRIREPSGDSTKRALKTVRVTEQIRPLPLPAQLGWERRVTAVNVPEGFALLISRPFLNDQRTLGQPRIEVADRPEQDWIQSGDREVTRIPARGSSAEIALHYSASLSTHDLPVTLPQTPLPPTARAVLSTPGFEGIQLPLPTSIMPTAMTFLPDGTLAFTSLKGHVYLAKDTNADGLEDTLVLVEEGLAAPFGIIADGDCLLVAHKPELLRLRDTNGDGRADERSVFATGWGFNDNYHDWTCGLVRDSQSNLFVGLGSDYSQPNRPLENSRWRGKVLKISPSGRIAPFSHSMRYPTGIAIDSRDRVFATDNQGEQNCFNELNHLRDGEHFGVPSWHERGKAPNGSPPAVQIPHPKTRSVNGIAFLPSSFPERSLSGHLIGCEYDLKYLVRCSLQEVGGQFQGAEFDFSIPNYPQADANFQGPLSIAVSPRGEIYIGSIHDSGWLGGLNVGSIVKLKLSTRTSNGLRDIRATPEGFELQFFNPINATAASLVKNYSLSGYQRVWQGTYATADSGRHSVTVSSATLIDPRTVNLKLDRLKEGFVYEVSVSGVSGSEPLFPCSGHYTLHRIP